MNQLQVVKKKEIDISKEVELSLIERVIIQGDLSKLTADQRVSYYQKVCETCGLNPYTRPFDYISLNGKLTLYAKKDATEQLRKVNGISIDSLEEKLIDDVFIVKASARSKDGRKDYATGAVSVANLKGEARANAIMKAETKAKRRVTLSISGLGWTDETEVDSIPNAKKANVDIETGEIIEVSNHVPEVIDNDTKLIQDKVDTKLNKNQKLVPLKPIDDHLLGAKEMIKTISEDEWSSLKKMISQCDESFQDKAWKRLSSLEFDDENYSKMDIEFYDKIKLATEGNIRKNNREKYEDNKSCPEVS